MIRNDILFMTLAMMMIAPVSAYSKTPKVEFKKVKVLPKSADYITPKDESTKEIKYAFVSDSISFGDRIFNSLVICSDGSWAIGVFEGASAGYIDVTPRYYSKINRAFFPKVKGRLYQDGKRLYLIDPKSDEAELQFWMEFRGGHYTIYFERNSSDVAYVYEWVELPNNWGLKRPEIRHLIYYCADLSDESFPENIPYVTLPKDKTKMAFRGSDWLYKPVFDYYFPKTENAKATAHKEWLNLTDCLKAITIVEYNNEFRIQYTDDAGKIFATRPLITFVDDYKVQMPKGVTGVLIMQKYHDEWNKTNTDKTIK